MNVLHLLTLVALLPVVGGVVYVVAAALPGFCRAQGLVAPITGRSSHAVPTPHGGGILFPWVVVPVGLALTWWWPLPFKGYLTVLLLGSLLVAYVSWLDDKHELSARLRLVIHLLVVALSLSLLPPLFDFMPLWLEKALLLLGWGWFVNLYNFMDGADGLAATQAAGMGVALACLVPAFAPLGLLVAAVALGFLRVNWHPARVFMGDVGSTWLGYTLGGLYLLAAADDTLAVIWPLATVPLAFCADATTTLLRRVAQGHKPWEPHKTFWFHRVLALGCTHAQLARRLAVVNVGLFAAAAGSYYAGVAPLGFAAGVVAMAGVAWYIRRQERAQARVQGQAEGRHVTSA